MIDDKGHVRHELDLAGAAWKPAGPEAEFAFVRHTDGVEYVAVRQPGGPTLVYTPSEWEAFQNGATDGEFNL